MAGDFGADSTTDVSTGTSDVMAFGGAIPRFVRDVDYGASSL